MCHVALNFKVYVGVIVMKEELLEFLRNGTSDFLGMVISIIGMLASTYVSTQINNYLIVLMIPIFLLQFCLFFSDWKRKRNRRKK